MMKDDKCGICFGRLCPMDEFGMFDGKKFTLDEAGFGVECDAAAHAGANIERFMAYGVWGPHKYKRKSQFQPYVLDLKTNQWDLTKFNEYYFPMMRRILARAQAANMSIIFDLFDGCEFRGTESIWSPWAVNNQGIMNFYGKDADKYSREFFLKCISEFKDFDIIWSFGNEPENKGFPAMAERVILPIVKAKKLDFNRLAYGATTKISAKDSIQDRVRQLVRDKFGPAAEKCIIMPDHGWPFTASLPVWGKKPYRKLYSDDGCYTGASKCDIRVGKGARPSATQWGILAKSILTKYPAALGGRERLISFEHLPAGFSTGSLECKVAPIRAISKAYRNKFGKWPCNYKP